VIKGHIDIIQILLDNGANVLDMERSPLHIACRLGKLEMISLLLRRGASVKQSNSQGKFPLGIAASTGNLSVAKILLDSDDINPDQEGLDGYTPLIWAAV